MKKDWNSQLAELGLKHFFEHRPSIDHTPGKNAKGGRRYKGSDDEGDSDEEDNGEDSDGDEVLLFKPQDKIRIGFELYKNMFYDPTRTQVRVLLNLKKTDTAIINISTMKGGRAPEVLKYENYLVTSTCPVDIGFRGNELNL